MSDPTTAAFSETERRLLSAVLDEILPPRDDGKLPGAGMLGVGDHVEAALRSLPDLRSMIAEGLADLERIARERGEAGFTSLSRPARLALLREQAFVLLLTFHACIGYYQHPRVLEALGLEARPPHPEGYPVEADDFALLENVRQRPRMYREC